MTVDPPENKERNRLGWGCAVALILLLPVAYVLSPPIVIWAIGNETFEKIAWIYQPLYWFEMNSDAYNWYLDLFPDEIYH